MTLGQARRRFRALISEFDSRVPPDSIVDGFLDAGMEATSRRVPFYVATDTTTLALVATTQEYSLPSDFVQSIFVTHNGLHLRKSSIEEWERTEKEWRAEPHGGLQEYAFYAMKIVFRPIPNAATVAVASAATIRYFACPPTVTSNWPNTLGNQSQQVPIYYAVYEWSIAHPDSEQALVRGEKYLAAFEREVELIGREYAARGLSR